VDSYRVLFLVAPTSLIWCCTTGARNPSGWAPPIRELRQEPSWPTLLGQLVEINTNSPIQGRDGDIGARWLARLPAVERSALVEKRRWRRGRSR
jgi:hypothetical protein